MFASPFFFAELEFDFARGAVGASFFTGGSAVVWLVMFCAEKSPA